MLKEAQIQMAVLADRLERLLESGSPDRELFRVEQPLPRLNALDWLSVQGSAGRSYWADREGDFEIAALGRVWCFELKESDDVQPAFDQLHALLASCPVGQSARGIGYLSFSDDPSTVWPEFGYGKFFLPALEIVQTRKESVVACNLMAGNNELWHESIKKALALVRAINWGSSPEPQEGFKLQPMTFQPCEAKWRKLIGHALSEFAEGKLEKVVLSREATMPSSGAIDPWHLLQQWRMSNPRSYIYAFEADSDRQSNDVFMGCSPERLFSRQGKMIWTEALAGTTRRGGSREEDFQMELRLRNDSKNVHENRLVLDDIQRRLAPLCDSLESDRSHSVLKLKTIQHLRFLIRGVLKEGVDDKLLLSTLHPTPAVGGSGREQAIEFIERHEAYARGLYAGVCGVIGLQNSELSVAIRCALVKQDAISLYSGAGIVKGSDSSDEWQELNNKIKTVCDLLELNESVLSKPVYCESSDEVSHQAS